MLGEIMNQRLLEGKRGVVLGVANERSIAWACAQACAEQGAELLFNYMDNRLEKRVRALIEGIPHAQAFPCDVGNDVEIAALFKEVHGLWGGLDFVIHSLAYADREDLRNQFITTSRAGFGRAMDISAYSLVAVAREAAPLMTEGGSIVAMTYHGSQKVVPGYNVMGVAKAALEASARYLAEDLGTDGIRVNCISAGPLKTLASSAVSSGRKMLRITEKAAPLRRNIEASEVGKTAVYLLSDLSSAVTGEVLHVDSGFNIVGMPPTS
jgi:enoyl-[acyl-carrier protein] reductase I